MQEGEKLSLEQMQVFLVSSAGIRFSGDDRKQVYGWIKGTCVITSTPNKSRRGYCHAEPIGPGSARTVWGSVLKLKCIQSRHWQTAIFRQNHCHLLDSTDSITTYIKIEFAL